MLRVNITQPCKGSCGGFWRDRPLSVYKASQPPCPHQCDGSAYVSTLYYRSNILIITQSPSLYVGPQVTREKILLLSITQSRSQGQSRTPPASEHTPKDLTAYLQSERSQYEASHNSDYLIWKAKSTQSSRSFWPLHQQVWCPRGRHVSV